MTDSFSDTNEPPVERVGPRVLAQAFVRGVMAAIVGGFFWSLFISMTQVRIVAVPVVSVSFFVGTAVRGASRTRSWPFGVLGALLGVLGSLVADGCTLWGSLISQLGALPHLAFHPAALKMLLAANWEIFDTVLYVLAAVEGWHFAVRAPRFGIGERYPAPIVILGLVACFGVFWWNVRRTDIDDIAASPDRKTLVATQSGHEVTVPNLLMQWDLLANRQQVFTLKSVERLAWSPEGRYLAVTMNANKSGGTDSGRVGIWDTVGLQIVATVTHSDFVESVDFAPDGRLLATGSQDGVVKLWSIPGFQEVGNLEHAYAVASVGFSNDSSRLAVGLRDGTLVLRDGAGFLNVESSKAHAASILALTFHADALITAGGIDAVVKVWDVGPLRLNATFEGGFDWITDLAVAPDGTSLAIAGGTFHHSGGVRLIDLAKGNEIRRFTTHADTVSGADFLDEGRTLVAGTSAPISPFTRRRNGELYRWDVATGRLLDPLP